MRAQCVLLALVLVWAGAALADGEPAGPAGGIVWQEINGSCQMEPDEPGLGGIDLLLFRDSDLDGLFTPGADEFVAETVSGPEGTYEFAGLTAGLYFVYLLDINVPPELAMLSGDNPVAVSLAPGQQNYTANFGFSGPGLLFLGEDGYTQGNWIGAYGGSASMLAGVGAPLMNVQQPIVNCAPGALDATANGINGLSYGVESGRVADPRALQTGTTGSRRAATLFNGSVAAVLITGLPLDHYQVAVYMVDFDRSGRRQMLMAQNNTSGDLTEISGFGDGVYAVFSVDMTVPGDTLTIAAQKLAGSNAVISGIFIDPMPGPPGVMLIDIDTSSRGNWTGSYGYDWHLLPGQHVLPDAPNAPPSYPNSGYVTADARDTVGGNLAGSITYGVMGYRYAWTETQGDECGNAYAWVWATPGDDNSAPDRLTTDPRALTVPALNGRVPAAWNDGGERFPGVGYPNLYVHVDIPQGFFLLSVYAVDFDRSNRAQVYNMRNADTGQLLGAFPVQLNGSGKYSLFNVTGPLKLTIETVNTAGPNAVLSGVFLDYFGGCN